MKKTALPFTLLLLCFTVGPACKKDGPADPEIRIFTHPPTQQPGQAVHDWMALAQQLARARTLQAPDAARAFGYLGLTAWESVCHGIPDAKSLAGQIEGYPQAPAVDPYKEYDWVIVLCTAMKTLLPALIEGCTGAQLDEIAALASAQENARMQTGLSEYVRLDSRSLGERIGERLIERLETDGRDAIRNITPVLPDRDDAHSWYWAPELAGQAPVEPVWSAVRPFVLAVSSACEPAAPLPYSETPGSPFRQQAEEVRTFNRTPEVIAAAYHWDDGPGRTSGPAGHWMSIAGQILQAQQRNLAECARVYCLAGLTAADTYSVCWYTKYKYFLLRPATYIRDVLQPGWKPLLFTPACPEHISAPAALGTALPAVLTGLLGDAAFVDATHAGSPLMTPAGGPFVLSERPFASLTAAGAEAGESGLAGGANFRQSIEQGRMSGSCVAQEVLDKLDFGF